MDMDKAVNKSFELSTENESLDSSFKVEIPSTQPENDDKGLNVAAEEVRKLPEQSNSSAENIMKVINQLQGNLDKVTVKKLTSNISNSSKSIVEVIEKISTSIKENSKINGESSVDLSMILDRLAKAAEAVEDITNSSQSQDEFAEKLNLLIEKFKI